MKGGDEIKNTRAILFGGVAPNWRGRRPFFGDFGEDTKELGEKTSMELGSLRTTIFMSSWAHLYLIFFLSIFYLFCLKYYVCRFIFWVFVIVKILWLGCGSRDEVISPLNSWWTILIDLWLLSTLVWALLGLNAFVFIVAFYQTP